RSLFVSGCQASFGRARPSRGGRCLDAKAGSPHGRFAMRQARFVPLRRRRLLGVMTACALAFAGWGCQQPPCFYYYGYGVPPCAPVVPAPSAAQSSAVGDVPTQIIEGGTATA